ncbi:MAG: cell wall-binding repeat-containing protein [Micrococcales bacterium]|nr:cell wall-binding repeat-containing protein [Micrococcales bacterium]
MAYQLRAPILLTLAGKSGALESTVKAEIQALHPSTIWILGGTSAIGTSVENTLKSLAPDVQRVWGTTKFDTAVEIARELAKQQGNPNLMAPAPIGGPTPTDSPDPTTDDSTTPTDVPLLNGGSSVSPPPALGTPAPGANICGVFVVSGDNFPDALSVSPVAARLGTPILLTGGKGGLNQSTHDYMARVNAAYVATLDPAQANVTTACIVGGTVAVPPAVDTALGKLIPTVKPRYAGASKYDTNVAVNAQFAWLFTGSALTFATGEKFPDALTGGAFAAKGVGYTLANRGYPFFLIPPSISAGSGTKAAITATGLTTAYIFGGPVALPDAIVNLHFA